jgi:hypothetical protein
MPPDADYPQQETDDGAEYGHQLGIHPKTEAHNQYGCARERCGRIDVGAKNRWNAGEQNVAYRAAANAGDASHQNRDEWMYSKIERLGSSRNCE